jgi:hypothetical protein
VTIFISHTHRDKSLVAPIAIKIADVFGRENVFYDSWSVQPGDGIIEKMNQGLSKCKFFFFFVSKQSLISNMVKLEWQNAIIKSTKGEARLIPVRIDDCLMPEILLQNLYIDIFTNGPEVAVRQIIDVINGQNTFDRTKVQEYQNLRAYIDRIENGLRIEIKAETYMEPHSNYMVLVSNSEGDLIYNAEESQFQSGFHENMRLSDGRIVNGIFLGRFPATSPGFPFIITLRKRSDVAIDFLGIMHAVSQTQWKGFPYIFR